jgi:hypothetical protein
MSFNDHVRKLPDDQLALAVGEIREFHKTGVLCNGVTRALAKDLEQEHVDHFASIRVAEDEVLMQAALRWVGTIVRKG